MAFEEGAERRLDPSNVVALDRPQADALPSQVDRMQERVLERPRQDGPAAPAASPSAAPRPADSAEATPAARTAPQAPAAAPAAPPPAAPAAAAPPAKKGRRRVVLPVILLAAIAGGSWYGHEWWTHGRFIESTDDAYVQADVATLGAKVAGYIAATPVKDGTFVKAGDVVARIDDTDFRLALEAAQAKRATQTATISRIDQQIGAQGAQIDAAQANVQSAQATVQAAEANARRAQADYQRATALQAQSFSTKAAIDQALATRDSSVAAVASARAAVVGVQAAVAAAQANLGVIKAQRAEAEATAHELDTSIAQAKSNLGYTLVRAPSDGVVGNRAAQLGQYVSAGARLMALVPMRSVYIAANFKETQLGGLKPGQPVTVTVDALDGESFTGRIESLAPASGSTFSLLPPENATGNFTKIVQRVPVRIAVPESIAAEDVLRAGLSVVVSVDTRSPGNAARPGLTSNAAAAQQ